MIYAMSLLYRIAIVALQLSYRIGLYYVKSVDIRNYCGPHVPSVSLRIESECGKIQTRITPNTDTFYVVLLSPLDYLLFSMINVLDRSWNAPLLKVISHVTFHSRWIALYDFEDN